MGLTKVMRCEMRSAIRSKPVQLSRHVIDVIAGVVLSRVRCFHAAASADPLRQCSNGLGIPLFVPIWKSRPLQPDGSAKELGSLVARSQSHAAQISGPVSDRKRERSASAMPNDVQCLPIKYHRHHESSHPRPPPPSAAAKMAISPTKSAASRPSSP